MILVYGLALPQKSVHKEALLQEKLSVWDLPLTTGLQGK